MLMLPAAENGEPPPAASGRFRLGPAGIAAVALGAAILAAITVALVIASQLPGADVGSTVAESPAPGGTTTAPSTATHDNSAGNPSTATTESFAGNPDTGSSARVATLLAAIEAQRQAGQLDGETVDELMKELEEVERELDQDNRGRAAEKLAGFRSKLDELHQDGKITTAGYDAVQTSLAQLADTLPPAEKDGKNHGGRGGDQQE